MNPEGLDLALRPLLRIFMKLLLESPVQRDGKLIPYEEVVSALERDMIYTYSSMDCFIPTIAMVSMQVQPEKYEAAVKLILDLLHSSLFTAEKVRVIVSKMLNETFEDKKVGMFMARDAIKCIFYPQESNERIFTVLARQKFLADLQKELDDPDQVTTILNKLNVIREFLTKSENLSLQIAVNISEHAKKPVNLSNAWGKICPAEDGSLKNEIQVTPLWKEINYKGSGLKDGFNGTVIGMGSIESAFLHHSVESINDDLSPDLPPLMVYLQYFTQPEGRLWKQIRGQGFASYFNIVLEKNEGLLSLFLYKATNVIAAFKGAKRVIESHFKDICLDDNLLESAKSSLIFLIINREKSVGPLYHNSMSFSYKNLPSNYNQVLASQVDKVTKAQLIDVGKKYIPQLFSAAAKTGIVCHPDKVEEITEGFASMNIKLDAASSFEDSILNN